MSTVPLDIGQVASRKDIMKALPRGLVGAEVGVWRGTFSQVILKYCCPKILYLFDNWFEGTDKGTYAYDEPIKCLHAVRGMMVRNRRAIIAGVLRPLCGLSPAVSALLPDEHLDFVYIDASHDYESHKADLAAWVPKVRPGGLIACHDYNMEGCSEAFWNRQAWGVGRAVREYCAEHGIEELRHTEDLVQTGYFVKPMEA